jgi:diguanylate cyclase (GGDEF)-like protein
MPMRSDIRPMERLRNSSANLKPWVKFVIGVGLVAVLGYIDYVTGYEILISLFYLIPIFIASWSVSLWGGISVAVLSAATTQIINALAGEHFSQPIIFYWNSIARLAIFVTVSVLSTQLYRLLEEEKTISHTDFLTETANSRAFYEKVIVNLNNARRGRVPITILYLDVDNFKSINDKYGHNTGDKLLRKVGAAMLQNVRITDTVARMGGDEFAILFPNTSYAAAQKVAVKIGKVLNEEMEKNRWNVTYSIGVFSYENSFPKTVDEMIRNVDRVMYAVKENGKDAVRHEKA